MVSRLRLVMHGNGVWRFWLTFPILTEPSPSNLRNVFSLETGYWGVGCVFPSMNFLLLERVLLGQFLLSALIFASFEECVDYGWVEHSILAC